MSADILSALIRDIVSLDAEIARVAKPLTDRRDKARQLLKDAMTDADVIDHIDAISGYRALIKQTMSDVYVPEKLLPLLHLEDQERVVDNVVTIKADEVKALVEAGVITRTRMKQAGALVRTLRARVLSIEPLKGAKP